MANYAESLLASGERITRRAHQHWFVFLANARYAVIALLIAIGLLLVRASFNLTGAIVDILGVVTLALFAIGVISLLWSVLRFRNEEYLITNRRIIHAEGVVNKKTTDSSLEKINDAVLTESMFGRMFGFGDLDVLTASEEGSERLRMLRDAKSFKIAMIEAKHELELELTRPTMPPLRSEPAPVTPVTPVAPVAPAAPVAPSAPLPDAVQAMSDRTDEIADALDRLGELRDKGLVTPEEFDAKRRELLERL